VFLDRSIAGARYLLSIADTANQGCLIFHHEPEGEDLYYLGWCHGPVGTARLFYLLAEFTGETEWHSWVRRSASSIMTSGIPEQQTPGFWNNQGQCCGSAGVAQFFLGLHDVYGDSAYLDFSRGVTDDLLKKATATPHGLKWIQAEHRRQPDLLVAQTGYMQGAAGIGMLLLRWHAAENGQSPKIVLPDDPFRGQCVP
jgi:lantibiotic modifying enzyme